MPFHYFSRASLEFFNTMVYIMFGSGFVRETLPLIQCCENVFFPQGQGNGDHCSISMSTVDIATSCLKALSRSHTERKPERMRTFSLMCVIYSAIIYACRLIFLLSLLLSLSVNRHNRNKND